MGESSRRAMVQMPDGRELDLAELMNRVTPCAGETQIDRLANLLLAEIEPCGFSARLMVRLLARTMWRLGRIEVIIEAARKRDFELELAAIEQLERLRGRIERSLHRMAATLQSVADAPAQDRQARVSGRIIEAGRLSQAQQHALARELKSVRYWH